MPASVPLVVVAAVGRNGAIGLRNRLPWTMPSDLAYFRRTTMGKPMIMGRSTFEAIGRVLPGRETIVVTRSAEPGGGQGLWRAGDPASALALARERAAAMGAGEVILAGGAALFRALMPEVARLRVTLIDLAPEADVFFPPIDHAVWREVPAAGPPPDPRDEARCRFVDYVRRGPGTRA